MLLAEINGKSVKELEGIEDLITSAVFGHLRSVPPQRFWPHLFRSAITTTTPPISLGDTLRAMGVQIELYQTLKMRFWPKFSHYGEPDLLLHFSGADVPPFLVLLEVKLYSSKSATGEKDQLTKYSRLLADLEALPESLAASNMRFLVYLTRVFAADEIDASFAQLRPEERSQPMFGLEWNDVRESALRSPTDELLREVAEFLRRRGLDRFCGFHSELDADRLTGDFYHTQYFLAKWQLPTQQLTGGFYGK